MTTQAKDEVVQRIRKFLAEKEPDITNREYGICVYLTVATFWVMTRETGMVCYPVAGSMSWPLIDMKDDDGASPTHFSYQFEGLDPLSSVRVPEMHSWVYVPFIDDGPTLIDLSTYGFPEQAKKVANLTWRGPRPPDYLWTNKLPPNVYYSPNLDASMYLARIVKSLFDKWSKA